MRKSLICAILSATGIGMAGLVCAPTKPGITISMSSELHKMNHAVFAAWTGYGLQRASWRTKTYYEKHPGDSVYTYTIAEEAECRSSLAKLWLELKSKDNVSDNYLDDLVKVENAGYMIEYVWRYFRSPYWTAPANLHEDQFTSWAVQNIPNHVCVTLVDVYSPEDKHKSADPRQQQELLNKATEALSGNRIKKAEALLEQVMQGMPAGWKAFTESDDTLFYAFWDEGEFDRCAKEHPDETVLAVFPSYSRVLYLLGYINVEKGDAEGALKRLDQALSLQPDHPVILLEKATILSKIGRLQEAYDGFVTAEKPHFALTPSLVARSLRGQGIVLIDLDRLDEAEACLGKSLKYDPESKVAVNELEYIQKLRTGQARPGAEKIYKRK